MSCLDKFGDMNAMSRISVLPYLSRCTHDIVGKVADGFEKPKVRISIWAVNGSQN